ncbi:MAG: hypothetical protein M1831_006386 [Alyxoria varia]|nr:MAG: hypothetical protein M1831_006386 [Alyxoria varia]
MPPVSCPATRRAARFFAADICPTCYRSLSTPSQPRNLSCRSSGLPSFRRTNLTNPSQRSSVLCLKNSGPSSIVDHGSQALSRTALSTQSRKSLHVTARSQLPASSSNDKPSSTHESPSPAPRHSPSTTSKPVSRPKPSNPQPNETSNTSHPTQSSSSAKSTTGKSNTASSSTPKRPSKPPRARPALNPDRGPPSKEDTVTDFNELDVFGRTAPPTTSIDVVADDEFLLDSGLKIGDSDGVLLVGGEAFVWRPWMGVGGGSGGDSGAAGSDGGIVTGEALRRATHTTATGKRDRSGGVITERGQFYIPDSAFAVLAAVWPRPGTGPSILPLHPSTKTYLTSTLGLRLEVLDSRNAASQFNMLATERGTDEVAAGLVSIGFGR